MTTKIFVARPPSKQRKPPHAELAFKGKLFEVWQWQQKLQNGTTATFEVLKRPDTVLILPVQPDGNVVLIDETQPGMSPMVRTIGGRIELGETPEQAASRELQEESGLTAAELRLWAAWQPVNKIDWAVYLFVAHGLNSTYEATPDAGEKISLRRFRAADLLEGPTAPNIDDYEFLHMLNYARSDAQEKDRVRALLSS
jgi:ADP-ribose pyrophosphatase